MVQFLISILLFINVSQAHVDSSEESSNTKKTPLTYQELRDRLTVVGDIYVTDTKGKLLFQENQSRLWKFGGTKEKSELISNLMFSSPNVKPIYIEQTWSITPDARIIAQIKQYDKMTKKNHSYEVIKGKIIKEQKIEVKNFEPINWLASTDEKSKVYLRLIPSLSYKTEAIDVDVFPITLKKAIVFDNQGRLWAQGQELLEGKYISMKTHMGQIALSLIPFKNAKEIGIVSGSQIDINFSPKLQIYIRSEEAILASTKPVKVYGLIDFNKKTERLGSVGSSSSSTEKEFNLK